MFKECQWDNIQFAGLQIELSNDQLVMHQRQYI